MGLFACLPWGRRNAVAVSAADSDAAQLGGRGAVSPTGHNKASAEGGKSAGEQVSTHGCAHHQEHERVAQGPVHVFPRSY